MTLTEANQIWEACYGSSLASETAHGWATYTERQRRQAIEIRQAEHDRQMGCFEIWHISDRH